MYSDVTKKDLGGMVNPLIMDPWEAVSLRQCRWGEGKVGKGKTILCTGDPYYVLYTALLIS
jgi:hypothetical protein